MENKYNIVVGGMDLGYDFNVAHGKPTVLSFGLDRSLCFEITTAEGDKRQPATKALNRQEVIGCIFYEMSNAPLTKGQSITMSVGLSGSDEEVTFEVKRIDCPLGFTA